VPLLKQGLFDHVEMQGVFAREYVVRVYIYMFVHICMFIYTHMYIYIICIYVYKHICMHMIIYIYIYI